MGLPNVAVSCNFYETHCLRGQCAFSAFPRRDGANAEFDIAGVQSTALTS